MVGLETTYTPSGDENSNVIVHIKRDIFETTYTPSGDENGLAICVIALVLGNNLHPVRGRKLVHLPKDAHAGF